MHTFNTGYKVKKASEFSSKGLGLEEVVKEIIMKIDWTGPHGVGWR